jgi:hypothetical protein
MADEQVDTAGGIADIKPTDIVFECPYCTKSLAIDYRGAGLTIKCTDCGRDVIVPIPEGLDLSDLDSTGAEQEIRLVNLRRSLGEAEARVGVLEAKLAALSASHEAFAKSQAKDRDRFDSILDAVHAIQRAQDEIAKALKTMSDSVHIG